jgi:hypothetical protein
MKKTPRKLVLRSETLRTLANRDLVRIVGGFDSGDKVCEGPAVFDTGAAACEGPAVIIATAAHR